MTFVYITVGLLVLLMIGVVIYARTGKPQINGLVWKEVGKDVHRWVNIKEEAQEAVRWFANDVDLDEKYPSDWHKPNINVTASRHCTYIPADLHNEYFEEIQKLLDERGRGEEITIRAYLYPLESGNVISMAPHIHTLKLNYSTGSPDGTREVGYYCTLCNSWFLYINNEATPEEVVKIEEDNRKGISAMCDLLDWTYGEGKYAEQKEKEEK